MKEGTSSIDQFSSEYSPDKNHNPTLIMKSKRLKITKKNILKNPCGSKIQIRFSFSYECFELPGRKWKGDFSFKRKMENAEV